MIRIIQTLRQVGCYQIVTCDALPYSYWLKIADAGYVVPEGNSPEFQKALEIILDRERPHYIVPIIDTEIAAFHQLAGRFETRVVAPVPAFCQMAFDKWLTYQGLSAAGIPMPETFLATVDAQQVPYPAVIKPRSATGSRGVAYLNHPRDLEAYLAEATRPADAYIVQRRLRGKEYSVSAVVALGGPLLAVVPKESIIKKGMSIVAVTRRCPEVEVLCQRIHDQLRPDGPFNLQLFLDDEGRPYVLEINPRFSGSIPLTIAAGVHELDLIIRHAEGDSLGQIDFTPDLLMIRYHTDEYQPEAHWKSLLAGHDLR